jgi:hypothetical protein
MGRGGGGGLYGIAVALSVGMADGPPRNEPPADEVVHQFPVNRGMAIVLVIETTFWYSGLLQAALARITLEGQN